MTAWEFSRETDQFVPGHAVLDRARPGLCGAFQNILEATTWSSSGLGVTGPGLAVLSHELCEAHGLDAREAIPLVANLSIALGRLGKQWNAIAVCGGRPAPAPSDVPAWAAVRARPFAFPSQQELESEAARAEVSATLDALESWLTRQVPTDMRAARLGGHIRAALAAFPQLLLPATAMAD
jgi:hypothetical protein